MRFLVRFRQAAKMTGVDATVKVVERGRRRATEEGLADRLEFRQAEVLQSGLPDAGADFVWGEDAWCYVTDKAQLIREAARMYIERKKRWKDIFVFGEKQVRRLRLSDRDVESEIGAYRRSKRGR